MKKFMLIVVAAVASLSVNAYTVTAKAVGALDTAMGSVEIKQGEAVVTSGSDLTGSVTITATANDANRPFVKWLGSGIPEGMETAATLTIENLASDVKIVPVFEGMWLYEELNATDKTGTLTEFRKDTTVAGWQLNVANVYSTAFTCVLGEADTTKLANGIRRVSAAYNPGEGELDISTPIVDADGNLWQITKWGIRSLAMNTASESVLTNEAIYGEWAIKGFAKKIIAPKTLVEMGPQVFNGPCTGLKDLIINCPVAKGYIPYQFLGKLTDATNIVVKCPKIFSVQDQSFSNSEIMKSGKICVDEWDLSGVSSIGNGVGNNNPGWGVGAFQSVSVKGTLRFPNVQNICIKAFYAFKTDGDLEFGTAGTIQRIRCFAFQNVEANRITFGGAANWRIGGEAVSLKNVKEILFVTDNLPTLNPNEKHEYSNKGETITNPADDKMFYNDTAEKTACFYVPKSIKWLNAMGALSKDDSGKYVMAAANYFGTTHAQYVRVDDLLTDIGCLIPYSVKVADPRYGDTIEVYVNDEKVHEGLGISGYVTNGTKLKFVAKCKEGNVPHWKAPNWGWKSDNREEEFIVTSDAKVGNIIKPVEIGLWSRHPWTFLPATEAYPTNRITDGIWTLNVCKAKIQNGNTMVIDDSQSTLAIGATTTSKGDAYTGKGDGILDLNGTITDSDNKSYTISYIMMNCLNNSDYSLTALVFPESLVWCSGQLFNDSSQPSLTTVIYDVPKLTKENNSNALFSKLGNLQLLYINEPKQPRIRNSTVPFAPFGNTDRSAWNFDGVTLVEGSAVEGKDKNRDNNDSAILGSINNREVLKFPSVLSFEKGWGNNDPAMDNMNVWGIELGSAYNHDVAKTLKIVNQDFRNNKELKYLKFGAYSNFTFNANAFLNCSNIEEVVFSGKCLMTEAEARTLLDTILLSVPANSETQKIQTVIRASMHIGWGQIRSDFADDTERADANALSSWLDDGERIVGVYVTQNSERKAWIVHRASEEYDPVGTIIIIR